MKRVKFKIEQKLEHFFKFVSVANDFKKPNVNVLIFCSSRRDFELYGAGLGIASGKDAEHFPGDIETS